MAVDRSYGEFNDFYSVSPDYFGYTFVYQEGRNVEVTVQIENPKKYVNCSERSSQPISEPLGH
jgi:hypothetical protein